MGTSDSNARILIRRLAAELYVSLSTVTNSQSNLFIDTKPLKEMYELI
jgi:hypothetical protein